MLPLQILIRLSQLLIRPMGPLQIFETANTASMAVGKDLQWQIPPVTPLLVKTAKKRLLCILLNPRKNERCIAMILPKYVCVPF